MGIARFEKVSYARFAESWKELSPLLTEEEIKRAYEQLRLPVRATARDRPAMTSLRRWI